MLISGSGVIKLSDFGYSNPRGKHTSDAPWYRAPEVDEGKSCLKSDVWSLGMSVIEMAEGKHPLASCTSFQVMKKVCDGEPPSLSSSEWSSDLVEFVKRCLVKDVNERASVEELLRVSVSSESED